MQEWVIQIPSIPILVSVLFPFLHLKYFRIKFLLLVEYSIGCTADIRVSYSQEVEGWSEVSTPFFVDWNFIKTTSGNSSKAGPSIKSDWTLSHPLGLTVPVQKKKLVFSP